MTIPEAQAELTKAAELDPTNAGKYYYNLGAVLVNANQTDAAAEAFKKAIQLDANYADAHYQYAITQMAKATVAADGKITPPAGTVEELQKYLELKPNMFMYWNMFRFASEHGYDTFDFGRCSIGSGTYRFKMQWGAQEVPLYWHQWRPDGAGLQEPKGTSSAFRLAAWMWQRMPLGLTNIVGPQLIKYLEGV